MYNIPELIQRPDVVDGLTASLAGRGRPPLLRCAKIKLTSLCNLRCEMCRYGRTRHEESLVTERWCQLLAGLVALGCQKVHFSGGEVFLRRDFLTLVARAVEVGLKTNLTTNGTLLDRQRAHQLGVLGVNGVSVSLDGPTAKVHDAIRGQAGAFRAAVRAVRLLRRHAPEVKVRVNTVLMRHNYERLPEVVRLAGELGAHEVVPMPVDEKGARQRRLSGRQIRSYNVEIAPRVAEVRQRYGFSLAPAAIFPFGVTEAEVRASARGLYARGVFDRRPCLAPWLHLFAAWDGNVYPCCMTNGRTAPLGNVAREDVAEVFHGPAYEGLRAAFREGRVLPSCARCDLFLGENALLHAALDERRELARACGEDALRIDATP